MILLQSLRNWLVAVAVWCSFAMFVVGGLFLFFYSTLAEVLNYESLGAIPNDDSYDVALKNGNLLNATLSNLQPGDRFVVPNSTYTLVGGIMASNISDVVFQIDGTLNFTNDRETWPKDANGHVLECIYLESLENVVFTSSGVGTLNGNGRPWWGALKFLKYQEDRPRLFHMKYTKNIIVENILFLDSPFWVRTLLYLFLTIFLSDILG
jgi:hypothetical protein